MISSVEKAFYKFWSKFGVSCYVKGNVPNNAEFPYITYDVEFGDTFSETILTSFVYTKSIKKRRELMDLISNEIPYGGTILNLDDNKSKLWIKRNDVSFQSYGNDIDDNSILYGRISYIIEFLTL